MKRKKKTPTAPAVVGQVVRARLAALIAAHGANLSRVALDMNHAHTWLSRKLDPTSSEPRPLTVSDIEAVLAHFGEPAEAILLPVLAVDQRAAVEFIAQQSNTPPPAKSLPVVVEGRRAALQFVPEPREWEPIAASLLFAGELVSDSQIRNLEDQGLIVYSGNGDQVALTELGRLALVHYHSPSVTD